MMRSLLVILTCCSALAGCGSQPVAPSAGHIQDKPRPTGVIPQPVEKSVALPPPKPTPKVETYSVVVNNVPVRELLFALARDAKLNIDIHVGIEGNVTLNALNQTLPQLLNRIAKQIDMRYEIENQILSILPDTPYLKQYKIDYLNMTRDSTSNVSIATQIASSGTGNIGGAGGGTATAGGAGGAGGAMSNNSTTSVTNRSNNRFWDTLVQNLRDILRETDKLLPTGSSETHIEQNNSQSTTGTGALLPTANVRGATSNSLASSPNAAAMDTNTSSTIQRSTFREAASVIANPENGILAVRATSRQHEKIQEFIDQVLSSAKRQVLIEATVLEVQLSDQFQQGINWQSLRNNATTGFNLSQGQVGGAPLPSGVNLGGTPGIFVLNYSNPISLLGNLSATIQLLESFGKVKVLSSPKISVLNNQTALLKVVDNRVYFTITATTTPAAAGVTPVTTYTSELKTVPVGFVMSVTPQIASSDEVTMNVRPTISRIIGYVQDPNPALANAVVPVVSNVPVIQAREMESILKVASGQVAVMGGLMQDSVNNLKDGVPGVSRLPGVGDLFSYRNESSTKTELVIFLRPVVVKEASIGGDYKAFQDNLPKEDFFSKAGPGDIAYSLNKLPSEAP